jgi:hypothetical protein
MGGGFYVLKRHRNECFQRQIYTTRYFLHFVADDFGCDVVIKMCTVLALFIGGLQKVQSQCYQFVG